jgi:hypothetical protein
VRPIDADPLHAIAFQLVGARWARLVFVSERGTGELGDASSGPVLDLLDDVDDRFVDRSPRHDFTA